MEKEPKTKQDILKMSAEELIVYLNRVCKMNVVKQVETVDELQEASRLLGHIGPLYSWLTSMELLANIEKKRLKNLDKQGYEEAIIKESIFSNYAKQMNILYNTISRMVTIKQQINQEMKMLGHSI